jgi:hypothetical protein
LRTMDKVHTASDKKKLHGLSPRANRRLSAK